MKYFFLMKKSYSNSTCNIFTEDHRSKPPIWISSYLPTYGWRQRCGDYLITQ